MSGAVNAAGQTRRAALWIGGSCFAAYAACYIGKNALSALLPQLLQEQTFAQEELGRMGSVFLLAYGVGQLVNGLLGNRVHPRYMVFLGLFLPGVLLALFPFCGSALAGTLLWAVCGFLGSMLWGPLSRMVGENTSPGAARLLLTLLTVASMLGTLLAYLLAAFASLCGATRPAFWLGGGCMAAVALLWLLACRRMERRGMVRQGEVKPLSAGGGRLTLGALLRNRVFLCVVIVTMLNGVIRNAVSFWIPTFLSQHLALRPEWVSVASSALPFVNIGGTFLSLWGLRLVRQNEKTMCVLLFVLAAACFGVVWLCPAGLPLLSMAALFAASAAMTGVCNMIFSVYILDFRSTGMISGITGFLDFSSYLSASAASLLFSDMMAQGWNAVILFWIATTALGALVSLLTRLLAGRRSGQPDGEAD